MRRFSSVPALGLLFLSRPVAAQAGGTDTTYRAVDRVFAAFRDTDAPGCALGVSKEGRTIYERGYGMANLETGTPIRPSSIFHVASVSKQFTATAIMLLARDGKLSVDDNIRKYLPEIPDYGTPITIRHLLTHTSGLRDQWELIGLARGRFEEDRITEADVMDIVPRQKALNFKPGDEYLYSNTGFTLLAVIVKRVSGQSLRDFADARIFKPLGMTSTHFHDDYTMLVPNRTSAYQPRGSSWRVSVPNFDVYGATSLFTTAGDLLKWENNFDKPVVGDRALFKQMETQARLTNGDSTGYGFGLSMGTYRGARVIEHNGADAGYRSYAGRFPEQGLAIAIACNTSTANTTGLARGVADVYLASALAPATTVASNAGNDVAQQAVAVPAASLAKRVGTYIQPTTRTIVELIARDGKLYQSRAPNAPPLVALAEDRFRSETGRVAVFRAGEHAGFDVNIPGAPRPTPYEWRPPIVASRSTLAPYAGEYFSDEVNARYVVSVATDSTIALRTGTSSPMVARPVFLDGFLGGGYTIEFTRKNGQVSGFEVTNGRMRRVRFDRVAGAGK
ncbi:MAG TPA: serine hydrolase domain-containing protein [Gemmatimonadaceae bacterium]|nr:serine hydrolase domain-containing protein [Gemmatimonadaceae bacterium]